MQTTCVSRSSTVVGLRYMFLLSCGKTTWICFSSIPLLLGVTIVSISPGTGRHRLNKPTRLGKIDHCQLYLAT